MGEVDARRLVTDLLEEHALAIGGLIATHPVDDGFVWKLMRSLDASGRKVLRRAEQRGDGRVSSDTPGVSRHPAIEEFLTRLSFTSSGRNSHDIND